MPRGAFEFGALYGSFEIIETDLFRSKGKFNNLGPAFQALNEQLATELQQKVAQALRHSLLRTEASHGTLERVLLAKRNRTVSRTGFGVGMMEFLDGSAAKYWLQIDQGTDVHKGQMMTGLWFDEVSGSKSRRRGVGQPRGFGKGDLQGFVPLSRGVANRRLREAHGLPGRGRLQRGQREAIGAVRGIIRNPIEGEHYFRRGWEEFGEGRRIQREYAALFKRLGIPARWGGSLGSGGHRALGS